jgi:glyoxylase-like metal-dependent hydrolase (beta-lactamase superfamily II)
VLVFRQFVDDDLGCASYLVGDRDAGVAVVVDPALAIEKYIEAAAEEQVRIERVLETHTHADHVSGHGRFAVEHDLPVAIHALAEAEYPCHALADGEVVCAGSTEIRVLHTPGHRPEHCAFVVDGKLVLTGDSLFVGDAARPDLAVAAREGAQDLFGSLERLAALGDDVEVYPGHVAGSLCGGNMSSERSSTIGRERETNDALSYRDVQVVDVREAFERDSGYIPGSRNIPYRLLRKIGCGALDVSKPVVTVCDTGPRAAIAASLLAREGFDARAVSPGGVATFDGDVVSFRRCGG